MEYLVKEWGGNYLGVTQPNTQVENEIKVLWEKGSISYPWWKREHVNERYEVIKELSDEEAQQYLFAWKIKHS
jgi:hypothetical protein